MNIEPEISVIVPVYNAEQYLERCLSSILSQSFKNFEVVLINDGSTDNSLRICEKFAEKDSRIRLFNRSNHGISATRQFGIDNAIGKYCIQVDADDWIDSDYLRLLYEEAIFSSADIVCAPFKKEYIDKTVNVRLYKPDAVRSYIEGLCVGKCYGVVWNKLLSMKIIKDRDIRFPLNVSMWEDLVFVLKYLLYSTKISFVKDVYYHYVQYNTKSLCKSSSFYDVVSHTVAAVSNVENFYRDRNAYFLYGDSFRILELFSKQKLLFDSHHRNFKRWLSTFPESNMEFFRFFCYILLLLFYRRY